jgi:hypothetical protein
VVRRDDLDHTAALVTALAEGLDRETVAALTSSAAPREDIPVHMTVGQLS